MNSKLLALAVTLTIVVIALALPTFNVFQERLSPYASGDEHVGLVMSVARNELGFEVVNTAVGAETLRALHNPGTTTVYVVFGVERGYTGSERDALLAFVRDGGHALILDDFGESATLLSRFGVGLTEGPLLESVPQASVFVRADILNATVTLVRPAAFILPANGTGIEVLARTAPTTVLDIDGDGEVEADDPPDAYPVAIRIRHGAGTIVAVSDPTFMTNGVVQGQAGGLTFFRNYLESVLPDGASLAVLVVDESRHVQGAAEVLTTIVRVPALALSRPAVLGTLLGIHAVFTLFALWRWRDDAPQVHVDGLDKPYWAGPSDATLEIARRSMDGGERR